MDLLTVCLLVFLLGYLAGSVPFGFLTAKLVAGIDIRQAGSGNIGATNVGRVLGGRWGMVVLALDALKGLLPVYFLPRLLLFPESGAFVHVQVLCGVATVLGHMFPCWLLFRGGKGVATAAGVVVVLAPWATLASVAVFIVCMALFRIVSLSSILAAIGFAACELVMLQPSPFSRETWSLGVFSLLVPLLIIYRHRGNLVRLARGEEPRFRLGDARRGE